MSVKFYRKSPQDVLDVIISCITYTHGDWPFDPVHWQPFVETFSDTLGAENENCIIVLLRHTKKYLPINVKNSLTHSGVLSGSVRLHSSSYYVQRITRALTKHPGDGSKN